jgi:biopolymer transport protein ExbB
MFIRLITLLLFLPIYTIAQDESQEEVPISIEDQRNNKIKALLDVVKENKSIYVQKDQVRVNDFIVLVDDRESMLARAKRDLAREKIRNENLEKRFEANEKELAELEESLQIYIGVVGDLFGVTRQFAGELLASTEKAVTFSEYPERIGVLRDIGETQVHNLDQLQNLWISYLDEIVSSGEVKAIEANIIDKNGESITGEIVRYGHFTTTYKNKFVTPVPELSGFELLQRQPERDVLKNLRKHQRSDGYKITSIDPTRGFLLSLYLDKPGWIDRIAQGKSIGFIIILIGISGFVFSIYKIYQLREQEKEIIADDAKVKVAMENSIKDTSSYESKENILDEFIINYTGKLEWGANWVKFFAAVAPLLGLLGTVIGMIETFQAITLFGTGDPKQMAGGISQALVTTMLGLIVAAPLLGLYTYISQKISNLSQVLEEKASYLLAQE